MGSTDRSTQVRFAFQMTDTVPAFVPSWMINHIMQGAIVKVYAKMREVAERMARDDPTCVHVPHVGRPEYAPTRQWYEDKVDAYLRSADLDRHEANPDSSIRRPKRSVMDEAPGGGNAVASNGRLWHACLSCLPKTE